MAEVAVVILNYNGAHYLAQFLPILLKFNEPNSTIFVADNASTDHSIQLLESDFPEIKLLKLTKNFGFAEGYNQALKQINAKYYILLNSDVEVTQNWLPPIISQLQDANIAACQPKLLNYNQKTHFEYAGAAGGFIDYFGYPFCRGRIAENLEEDQRQYNDNSKIFWASGACLAIRADTFHEIGGFDGDFFAHMEEIDLCWRLQLAGYEISYTSASTVYHIGGGTLHKSNPFKTYLNFRNGLFMVYKNFPKKYFVLRVIGRMILDGIAALSYLPKGEFSNFVAVFKAHMQFYKSWPALRKKRKTVKSLKNAEANIATIIPKSIFWEFIKNKKLKFSDML